MRNAFWNTITKHGKLSNAAFAQTVPSARPLTLGTGLTNTAGTCNTGTQQAVGNIVQQDCVQAYTSGPHSVSLSNGVGIYAANGGSAITFNLQNLRKLHVLAVIEKARAKRAERAEMTAEHGGN